MGWDLAAMRRHHVVKFVTCTGSEDLIIVNLLALQHVSWDAYMTWMTSCTSGSSTTGRTNMQMLVQALAAKGGMNHQDATAQRDTIMAGQIVAGLMQTRNMHEAMQKGEAIMNEYIESER